MRCEFRDIDDAVIDVYDVPEPLPLRYRMPIPMTQNQLKPRNFEVLEFERGLVDFQRNIAFYRRVR